MEEMKSKIITQFKILERNEKESKKTLARTKLSAKAYGTTIRNYTEVEGMMSDDNVEYEIVGKWVNMKKQKIERCQ